MTRRTFLLLTLLLAGLGFSADHAWAQGRELHFPLIEKGVCPFEGCVYRDWVTFSSVPAYSNEGDTSSVAFMLKPMDSLKAISGNVWIERPGLVVVERDSAPHHFGDTLYVLSYDGEGFYETWFYGSTTYEKVFWQTSVDIREYGRGYLGSYGEMIQAPIMVWWVHIMNSHGQSGWLRLPNTAELGFSIEPQIHGMDLLE